MPAMMPRLLYVSPGDQRAAYASISAALQHAVSGDTVLVGAGRYAPSQTGERFPLYVPPGVTLAGVGQRDSSIDGEGAMDVSFRPIRPGESLVLLGDGSVLSGLVVINGGGNGVSTQPGARVLITRNVIRGHGQHGVLISGPQEAVIKDNIFLDNGTKRFSPVTPLGAQARQGHHIFVQGKGGADNRVIIIDNTLTRASADGLAVVVLLDEPPSVAMHVSIIDNLIEQSERRGLTIAASCSGPRQQVVVDVRRNIIRHNADCGVVAQTARPLVPTLVSDSCLRLQICDNECSHSVEGMALFGGFGPAKANQLEATIVGNRISAMQGHALRLIGGIGSRGYGAYGNHLRALISHNRVENVGGIPIFLQGGAAEAQEEATENEVWARVISNTLPTVEGQPAVLINDGLLGNVVQLAEPAQAYERLGGARPFHA
jgi:hypothetical protein